MKTTPVKVLLIEDDEDDVLLVREYLAESGNFTFELEWEPKPEQARLKMVLGSHDVFLIDYRLGSETGLDLIKFAQQKGVITPSILLTGQGDLKVDLDATRFGAADYLVKTELNGPILERSIRYALSQAKVIRELDEKEKRYRSLFERSVDPIFLANEHLKLVDVNESFMKFFQYSKQEALALKIKDLFAEESDYEKFYSNLKDLEQVRDYDCYMINKNGSKKGCLVNCVFIPDQLSEFCCYQGIIHDQTMRKKAERDMIIAERLSMTGKIARTIAHEVRNPLTNLTLAFDQLKEEIPTETPDIKLYSDIIERNANRIEQLISEMLNSSKPKELNLELTPIHEILEETLALSIDRINLNQIKLEKNIQRDLPRVLLDREKIKIALLNIIINGLEAMQPGSGILKVSTELRNGSIAALICDNGKGIASEEIEKLFDPFYTGKPGGMGLGLTSTKNILNSHSAEVEVLSAIGEGTTFCISFKLPE
ncbi:ATP-binding protein [Chryseolinea sp. H1M3-3]|uniref:hybrid sensor histidine kinase/response regulator n=1 Tax=Chryseolinea sp. H1M3-3 TaxID=3034144 RepID=UPI0023EBA6E6|nr:ATP-binding protein [Chryseolinea sp. H1M3-3]